MIVQFIDLYRDKSLLLNPKRSGHKKNGTRKFIWRKFKLLRAKKKEI